METRKSVQRQKTGNDCDRALMWQRRIIVLLLSLLLLLLLLYVYYCQTRYTQYILYNHTLK